MRCRNLSRQPTCNEMVDACKPLHACRIYTEVLFGVEKLSENDYKTLLLRCVFKLNHVVPKFKYY